MVSSVERSALVPYSAKQMYDLVNDTACYPQFVPYCTQAVVHYSCENAQEATLHFAKGAIKTSFTTRNRLIPERQIEVHLVRGPFKRLTGIWEFIALDEHACRVQLNLEFELSNPLFRATLGKLFNQIADRLVTTFVQRASKIYA